MPVDPDPAPAASVFPIFLNIKYLRVLIVGGGETGIRRTRALVEAGCREIRIVDPAPIAPPPEPALHVRETFRAEHLAGVDLVIIATNRVNVNESVGKACRDRKIWCNRADDAGAGDFVVPLTRRLGPVTLSVSTGVPGVTRQVATACQTTAEPFVDLARHGAALRKAILESDLEDHHKEAALKTLGEAEAVEIAHHGLAALEVWLLKRQPAVRAVFKV